MPSRFETVRVRMAPPFILAATTVSEGVSRCTRQLVMPSGFAFMAGVERAIPAMKSFRYFDFSASLGKAWYSFPTSSPMARKFSQSIIVWASDEPLTMEKNAVFANLTSALLLALGEHPGIAARIAMQPNAII